MLHWKAIFIILAIVFAVIGFIGIGEGGIEPAKYISGMFVVLVMTFWVTDFVCRKRKNRG